MVVEDGLPVTLPSGVVFYVLTSSEVDYVKDRVKRYLTDNKFSNVADLQTLDQVITLETLVFRWSLWLSRQKDYWDDDIDEKSFRSSVNDYVGEIRQIKKSLGIDKVARDKAKGEDSVHEYLANLRERAMAFGVHRDNQTAKAIELFQQLKMLLTLSENCDAIEQREMHCTPDDVMEWIKTVAIPEFDQIDAYFRETNQRTWVRSM